MSKSTNTTRQTTKPQSTAGLYKISDLARETGVPTGTIKFYIREGLLPKPTLKTGRNMAWYDHSFVERIRVIKELQQKRFLPLEVIKAILEHDSAVVSEREISTLLGIEGTLYQEVHYAPDQPPVPVEEALARYEVDRDRFDFCARLGIITPVQRDGVECVEGDDLLLLENFQAMRRAGIGPELFPYETTLPIYVDALEKLAREELKIFSRAVTDRSDPERVPEMAIAAMKYAEQFMALLRRKMILRAMAELRLESETEITGTND